MSCCLAIAIGNLCNDYTKIPFFAVSGSLSLWKNEVFKYQPIFKHVLNLKGFCQVEVKSAIL